MGDFIAHLIKITAQCRDDNTSYTDQVVEGGQNLPCQANQEATGIRHCDTASFLSCIKAIGCWKTLTNTKITLLRVNVSGAGHLCTLANILIGVFS